MRQAAEDLPPSSTTAGITGEEPLAGSEGTFGDYRLQGEIAVGGMGIVYGATQISLTRTVAIKMIRSGQLATPEEVRRFRSEAEAAATLDHPHIVPIYEVGEHGGQHYFSMKLIEGGNLAETAAACRTPTRAWTRRAARIVATIALAVHHAHQRGLLHRDIKPTNILIDDAGEPHLTDFGLAKWVERTRDATHTQAILGTPCYMAPEQALGNNRAVTTSADIYSLGAVLYELLAGRPPFEGDSALAILHQVQEREAPPFRATHPEVDRDLETICLKCLEKEPQRRYASAQALAQDLARWLDGKTIQARPASQSERLWKWGRRNPVVAALGTTAIVILILGAGGVLSQWRRAESNAARAKVSAYESRQRLVRLNVANGVRLLDEGDSFGSLVWFGEALKLVANDKTQEANHRLRLASVIQQSPHLLQIWFPGAPVQMAAFRRDGRYVVIANSSNTVQLWQVADGAPATEPLRHEGDGPIQAHLNAEGDRLLTANSDGARVWSIPAGKVIIRAAHPGLRDAAFAPDGQSFITAGRDGLVKLWQVDAANTPQAELLHSNGVTSASFSGDGRRVLTFDDNRLVYVWDLKTGLTTVPPWKPQGSPRSAALNSNGTQVVTAHADGIAQIWDAATGKLLVTAPKEGTWLTHAAFSPDGKRFLTTAGGHVGRVLDATTGKRVAQISGHKNVVVSAAFSADGNKIISCSFDGTARICDARDGKSLAPPIWHGGLVTAAEFHPDSERFLTASADGTVRLWQLRPAASAKIPWDDAGARIVNASRDGSALVLQSTSGVMRAWNTLTWKPASAALTLTNMALKAWLHSDRQRLLSLGLTSGSAGYQFDIKTWEMDSGKLVSSVFANCTQTDWFFPSPDFTTFALYGKNQVQVFDIATGAALFPALTFAQPVSLVELSPDGDRLLVVSGHEAHVFLVATGRPLFPALQESCAIGDAEFSRDGRYIVTAGLDNRLEPRAAHVWNSRTGEPVGRELRHADGVFRAAFSPDNTAVVTASEDATARLWQAATGQPLTPPLRHSVAVYDATFSPDARWIATSSHDHSARIWDARTGEALTPRLKHDNRVDQAVFLSNGRYLLTRSGFIILKLWELPSDDRPLEDLVALAELLSGHHLDSTGALAPVEAEAQRATWNTLRGKYSKDFAGSLD